MKFLVPQNQTILRMEEVEALIPPSWKDNLDVSFGSPIDYGKTPQNTLFHDLPKEEGKGQEETAQKTLCYEGARVARDRIMSMSTRQRRSFGIHDRRMGLAKAFDNFGFFLSRIVEGDPNIFAKYHFLTEMAPYLQLDELRIFVFFMLNCNAVGGCNTPKELLNMAIEWRNGEKK